MKDIISLHNSYKSISKNLGIIKHIMRLPRLNGDPLMYNYGIAPGQTTYINGEKFEGRSSGCNSNWEQAILGTIGETVERYACAFYNLKDSKLTTFSDLKKQGDHAISPKEFALFHNQQFNDKRFQIKKYTEEIKLRYFETIDLTTGNKTWLPGQFIYLPFKADDSYITANTSTGLSAHTEYNQAILGGLYESIERDSFVLTWMQELVTPKIVISNIIQNYIDSIFPTKYEWHFFDITFDIKVPTVFGICFGKSEYGDFIAVGSSTRSTYSEALKKVIQEIGQAVPYFRYLLGKKKEWQPDDDFNKLHDFEEHSIFYTKRKDLWHVFDKWRNKKQSFHIDFEEKDHRLDEEIIQSILKDLKEKKYNVLFKDLTTPDVNDLGFYSIKIFIPQLIQMAGAYPFYFLGGKRLYDIPKKMGYNSREFNHLNKYPHPFP